MWNVRSLFRAVSLKTVASESAECKFNLVAVQEVRWGNGDSEPADDYTFLWGNGNANHHLGMHFVIYIRESYQQLRGQNLLLVGYDI